ncbi:hypothetical protein HGO34_27605 [Agrobacterium vitis]|uniref:4'-phosphopantetheinyl transferase superfamily protein n=1 Tax=Agrobacterium vitis TaxID=373 RepID=A0AAE5AZ67_AGRVI|nr:hypothetical protein [Agrobacterium vitis]MCF1501999.1 hypothetical protein [Allorhizobium sp. Av2]MCM2443463.1 hypothetical protein [Agrobacterium vitis]MUZ61045.1 hypothetical protein [Agrobacterium vitis]MVA69367.1 hypothetical protein [Agrobacterium vitis]MVA90337.1 hypothetical protein [Agrobacterium vitis]
MRDSDVHFSLSHCSAWVGLALDRMAPVGLDIEQMPARAVWGDVLPNLAPLPAGLSALQYWTAIEATLKAQRTAFVLDPRLLQMCASEDGFQARSPEFAVSGSWCPADDHHLIAVAGGGIQRLWHISRTSKDLGTRLGAL